MNLYRTSDLALAAWLNMNHHLEEIEESGSRKRIMVFIETQRLLADVEDYWKGRVQVCPKRYFQQIREIKARLYD